MVRGKIGEPSEFLDLRRHLVVEEIRPRISWPYEAPQYLLTVRPDFFEADRSAL